MDSYQKAIEYYSALDNKCFEDFLNRMTNLFKREEIQKALSQPEEEEKIKESANNSNPTSSVVDTTQESNTSEEQLKEEVFKFDEEDVEVGGKLI